MWRIMQTTESRRKWVFTFLKHPTKDYTAIQRLLREHICMSPTRISETLINEMLLWQMNGEIWVIFFCFVRFLRNEIPRKGRRAVERIYFVRGSALVHIRIMISFLKCESLKKGIFARWVFVRARNDEAWANDEVILLEEEIQIVVLEI